MISCLWGACGALDVQTTDDTQTFMKYHISSEKKFLK